MQKGIRRNSAIEAVLPRAPGAMKQAGTLEGQAKLIERIKTEYYQQKRSGKWYREPHPNAICWALHWLERRWPDQSYRRGSKKARR